MHANKKTANGENCSLEYVLFIDNFLNVQFQLWIIIVLWRFSEKQEAHELQ